MVWVREARGGSSTGKWTQRVYILHIVELDTLAQEDVVCLHH